MNEALLEEAHDWDAVERALNDLMREMEEYSPDSDSIIGAIDLVIVNLPGRKTNEH